MADRATILFVNLDTGEKESRPADEVPESIAFVEGDEGPVRVARIEQASDGQTLTTHSYDSAGKLLATTTLGLAE